MEKNLSTNEIAKEMSSNEKTAAKTRRRRVTTPVYSVLKRARAQFGRQVDHNTETKRKCIEQNIAGFYDDPLRFWLDFKNETRALLDSIEFNGYCEKLRLNPEYVAQHVVYEGKSIKNRVRDFGLDSVLGAQVMKFNAPLYVDTEGLYRKQITDGSENRQAADVESVKVPVMNPVE